MNQTGVLWTCDRCGKTEFVAVEFRAVSANDIQHIELWCRPRDWVNFHDLLLCPDCEKIYTEPLEKFLDDAKQWYERIENAQG